MNKKSIGLIAALTILGVTNSYAQIATTGNYSALTSAGNAQSKVLVYRGDKGYYATLSPAYIYLNGEKVASLNRNQHTVFCVTPGRQLLGSHLEDAWIYRDKNRRDTPINFEAGKTYLLKVQDEERMRYLSPTANDPETVVRETPTSQNVAVTFRGNNLSKLVPCDGYVTPPPPPAPVVIREVTLGADALFPFDRSGKDDLLPAGRAKLDNLAQDLNQVKVQNIHITGYTDRLGDDAYNLRLSLARAETVRNYLVTKGVSTSVMTVEGLGKANPVAECTNNSRQELLDCLQPNRRVVLSIKAATR